MKMRMAILCACLAVTAVAAEISPVYYREMQQKAPERLRVRVTAFSLDGSAGQSERKASVSAEVTGIKKTSARLKKGNLVYFEYIIFSPERGWAGPRPMPELTEGQEYDFFGERVGVNKAKGVILKPTARGYSFESLIE